MTNALPNNPSISLLKKQAKKLLKQVRENQTDALSFAASHHPKPDSFAGLRDAQLVIARSYGFPGWSELTEAVELAQDERKSLKDKATLFIQLGCVQYSGSDTLRNYQRAHKLLVANPELAEYSFYTALVANNAKAVSSYLESDTSLAVTQGGPLDWPPLLYVTYSRIDEPETTRNSLAVVEQLLKHGANPDSQVILNDTYRFTALTGAMGEGEAGANQPPHQYSDDMVALLLDHGANPNDAQGLYNTMFTDSVDKWLELLIDKGLNKNDLLNWNATGGDAEIATLDFQLANAVASNRPARVTRLLHAGANPNARNTYNGRAIHTNALLANYTTIAQLLEVRGAIPETLDHKDQFRIACVREDADGITQMLEAHPDLTDDAELLHAVAEHAKPQSVKALIAKGFDVDGLSEHGRTLLHNYALKNDTESIRDLLVLGARTDIKDSAHNSSAAGFAAYSGSYEAMRLLLDQSNSLLDVACCAYLSRAKTLLKSNPDSVHQRTERGNTVLHLIGCWLNEEPDYDTYKSMVECFVLAGADIYAKNKQDQTPAQFNQAHGYETLAELLSNDNL